MSFDISEIKLTRNDPASGAPLTANIYRLDGVNGGNPIGIAALVMALCLSRATELEARIIEIMEEMEQTTEKLEKLTAIEEKLIDGRSLTNDEKNFLSSLGVAENVSKIESTMDSLNSFSQEIMIDLQSQTNKRDQAYDMAANMLKSLYTVHTGIANNL